jgi:hypothetical protein
VTGVAEGLGEEELVGALAGGIREGGAEGDDGLGGMAGVDGSLASGGPADGQFLAVGDEGAEEKECDKEQDDGDEQQTEQGQGVAEDQPSLEDRIFFCLQCHKADSNGCSFSGENVSL